MDIFLERHTLQKLTQGEKIENLNKPGIVEEIEVIILFQNPTKKTPGTCGFAG